MSAIGSLLGKFGDVADFFFEETEVSRHITIGRTFGGIKLPHLDQDSGVTSTDIHFQDIGAPGLIDNSLPVLFFTVNHLGRPSFSIRVNSTRVFAHDFSSSDTPGTWHVFIPRGALQREHNEIVLSIGNTSQAQTQVIVGDMVILYKSSELTIRRPQVVVATQ